MTTPSISDRPIAVISALPQEAHDIQDALANRQSIKWAGGVVCQGMLENRTVALSICGVGKTLAAMTAQHVLEKYQPRALIFVGLAGGISPKFKRGDVILGEELLQHDMDARPGGFQRAEIPYTGIRVLKGDERLLSIAECAVLEGHRVIRGRILTGDQFVTHAAPKKSVDGPGEVAATQWEYLSQELQGDAVEMEGASIALVAHLHRVPCLIVRTISDGGDPDAFRDFSSFLSEASHRSLKVLRHILKHYSTGQ